MSRETKIIEKHIQRLKTKSTHMLHIYKVDIHNYYISFICPQNSHYAGQLHILHLTITSKFPLEAPKVKFLTNIFHTNISPGSGWVCVDVLNSAWSATIGLLGIVEQIFALFDDPSETGHHLNSEAAILEQAARARYKNLKKNAYISITELDKMRDKEYAEFRKKCKDYYKTYSSKSKNGQTNYSIIKKHMVHYAEDYNKIEDECKSSNEASSLFKFMTYDIDKL